MGFDRYIENIERARDTLGNDVPLVKLGLVYKAENIISLWLSKRVFSFVITKAFGTTANVRCRG